MSEKEIEIKTSILELLNKALMPIYYRLESLLESNFEKDLILTEGERALLLEYTAHANTLKVLFEHYLEEAKGQELMAIPQSQYLMIINMSKSVETAARASFGTTSMWAH